MLLKKIDKQENPENEQSYEEIKKDKMSIGSTIQNKDNFNGDWAWTFSPHFIPPQL